MDLFAQMMIEKIESLGEQGWQKPWFTEGAPAWPKNMNGREYNGMNAVMLSLLCEQKGYTIPRFCTFDAVQRMNKTDSEKGEDSEQERVLINKGEKSFPVMLTTFTCVHKDTKERIPYDDYQQLSDKEKEDYNVFPRMHVYRVFNVAQTNLQQVRPQLWAQLESENARPEKTEGEDFRFEPLDRMVRGNLWICPIRPQQQDNAYYSISKNEIIVPEKGQFKDGQSYYGTMLHEMTHSTGAESQLARIKPGGFGSKDYAREELVAELGSALVCLRYGMAKHLKEDSAAYIKSWLDSLRESPQFIKSTLLDVKKASSMITQRIDNVALTIEQERALLAPLEQDAPAISAPAMQQEEEPQIDASQQELQEDEPEPAVSEDSELLVSEDSELVAAEESIPRRMHR